MTQGYTAPSFLGGLYRSRYPFQAVNTDTTLTAAARDTIPLTTTSGANTKTTYAELIAATTNNAYGLELGFVIPSSNSVQRNALLDIALGAAAAETDVIPNLEVGFSTPQTNARWWRFPGLYIPAGSRISARWQTTAASVTAGAIINALSSAAFPPAGSAYTTYGADTSNSRGVTVVGAANAYGSWTQIGTTSADHGIFSVGAGPGPSGQGAADTILIQLGYGPTSGSVTIMATVRMVHLGSQGFATIEGQPVYGNLPSGTNIWTRVAKANTNSLDITVTAI